MALFFANFLIALREGVEAALVVGIIVAYIVKVNRRDVLPKLWLGVVLAAVIPLGLGVYWTWGPSTITFQTQEILGGVLSLVAVGFVTWMIFWMGKNSRRIGMGVAEKTQENLESGNTWGIVWMAIISVIREGAETAIFVWATVKSTGTTGMIEPAAGVIVGLLASIVVGWIVYKGSVALNIHVFFNVTGYLLILVAAGIVMYGIGDLQEASVLPGWGIYLYNYSATIAPVAGTWWFVLLNAFFNAAYMFYPTHLQFIGWIGYLVIVLVLFTLQITGKIFTDKKLDAELAAKKEAKLAAEAAAAAEAAEGDKAVAEAADEVKAEAAQAAAEATAAAEEAPAAAEAAAEDAAAEPEAASEAQPAQ